MNFCSDCVSVRLVKIESHENWIKIKWFRSLVRLLCAHSIIIVNAVIRFRTAQFYTALVIDTCASTTPRLWMNGECILFGFGRRNVEATETR